MLNEVTDLERIIITSWYTGKMTKGLSDHLLFSMMNNWSICSKLNLWKSCISAWSFAGCYLETSNSVYLGKEVDCLGDE